MVECRSRREAGAAGTGWGGQATVGCTASKSKIRSAAPAARCKSPPTSLIGARRRCGDDRIGDKGGQLPIGNFARQQIMTANP